MEEDEMSKACSTNEEMTNAHSILVFKPEGNRILGGPRNR
jgi:hypothetical protein